MKMLSLKKLPVVCAVSTAILSSVTVSADEVEEQLAAIKLSTFNQQLLVNTVYQEKSTTYVDAELLTKVDSLPAGCDPQSAFPVSEQHVDNPASTLVGNWKMDTEPFDESDDMDDEQNEQENEMEDEEDSQGDEMEDENSDQGSDQDTNDETGDEGSEDGELDMEFNGDLDGYLTVTASGYLVSSEVETVDSVTTCKVRFIGEVNGDTYTVPAKTGAKK